MQAIQAFWSTMQPYVVTIVLIGVVGAVVVVLRGWR